MAFSLYAGLLGIMFVLLSLYVVRGRRHFHVALQDGGRTELQRRVRAHGNFAEYAGFSLLLLGLAEFNGMPSWAVHALGSLFLAGRLLHAYSLLKAERYENGRLVGGTAFRATGMLCTFLVISALSAVLLAQFAGGKEP
jgi:uncharacterized membrane protein YecN with MAPEG domain